MTSIDNGLNTLAKSSVERENITIDAGSEALRGWLYRGVGDRFTTAQGRAAVVMAHGIGCTKDSGLPQFAEALSSAGLDVVLFDYRNFGSSDGSRRQVATPAAQLQDYRAAIEFARRMPGADSERILVWGVSFSGGHVFALAGTDPRIAGVIALTPAPDGRASARNIVRRNGLRHMSRCILAGLRDQLGSMIGRPPFVVPIVGEPGTLAALNSEGALQKHLDMAGPTWRNEIAARAFLRVGAYNPITYAKNIRVPVLVQVADFDRSAPPSGAMKAAGRSGAEVRHYPCDHFDVYPGQEWFDTVVRHQIDFVARHFAVKS